MATNAKRNLLEVGSLKGFMSARAPLALPQGYASTVFDGRLEDGTLRVRWGSALTASFPKQFRGCAEFAFGGQPTLFVAGRESGQTTVGYAQGSLAAFTYIMPDTGPYTGTRFPSEGTVTMALVNDGGKDWLVMQNGVDAPRLWDGTTPVVVSQAASIARAIVSQGFATGAEFSTLTTPVDSNSAHLDGLLATQAGQRVLNVVVKTAVASSDTSITTFTPFVVPSGDRQFVWLVDSTDERWRSLKIEAAATSAGPWTAVYDPATSSPVAVRTEGLSGTAYAAAVSASSVSGATVGAFRFSYQGDQPSVDFVVALFAARIGGVVPGTTGYGVSLGTAGVPFYGPGTVATDYRKAEYAGIVGPRILAVDVGPVRP